MRLINFFTDYGSVFDPTSQAAAAAAAAAANHPHLDPYPDFGLVSRYVLFMKVFLYLFAKRKHIV